MSFRLRLISFLLLIVVIPMAVLAFLVFGLINDSQRGKADARLNGVASTAASVYEHASESASLEARTAAQALEGGDRRAIGARLKVLARRIGAARIVVTSDGTTVADYGDPTAIAPGVAIVRRAGSSQTRSVTLSALTAAQYARQVSGRDIAVIVRQGGRVLGYHGPGDRLPGRPAVGRGQARRGHVQSGDAALQRCRAQSRSR